MNENYNIFKALHLEKKELIHSAMIAAIISKDDNRKSFIKMLNRCLTNDLNKQIVTDTSKFQLDKLENSIDVENKDNKWIDTEVHLLEKIPTSNTTRDRGRADIWIGTNKKGETKKYRLIIENKINAGNQYRQLRRYYRYLTETRTSETGIHREYAGLFFLCVKGDKSDRDKAEASAQPFNSESDGKKSKATVYAIITYKDIIGWLEKVILKTEEGDFKTAVMQYKTILEDFYPKKTK
jgi:hypothetical protein